MRKERERRGNERYGRVKSGFVEILRTAIFQSFLNIVQICWYIMVKEWAMYPQNDIYLVSQQRKNTSAQSFSHFIPSPASAEERVLEENQEMVVLTNSLRKTRDPGPEIILLRVMRHQALSAASGLGLHLT